MASSALLPICFVVWKCQQLLTTTPEGNPLPITDGNQCMNTLVPLSCRWNDPSGFDTLPRTSMVTWLYQCSSYFQGKYLLWNPCIQLCFWELEWKEPGGQMDIKVTDQGSCSEGLSMGSTLRQTGSCWADCEGAVDGFWLVIGEREATDVKGANRTTQGWHWLALPVLLLQCPALSPFNTYWAPLYARPWSRCLGCIKDHWPSGACIYINMDDK